MSFFTINPANEEKIKEYQELNTQEINFQLEKSSNAFKLWRKESYSKKSSLMLNTARILKENRDKYGKIMSIEMGKPLAQAKAEVDKCAWVCEYYAENAEKHLKNIDIKSDYSKSYTHFSPIGSILAIMPWNFPFWQVFRFAAPALMAGNVGVLKHARNTMECAIEIEKIFLEAGFPEGVFTNLVVGASAVDYVIEHDTISAVTLTGSSEVGAKVSAKAGSTIKKTVMELGGSDPYIIFADCDLEKTVEACAIGRYINSGQSCIAAKRFIVEKSIVKDFEELFVEKSKSFLMGDPLNDDTKIGPQARKDLKDILIRQEQESLKLGAKLIYQADNNFDKGYYYPPTVLTNVKKEMPVYYEETFGPLSAIIEFENEEQAIEIANDNIYGLGSAVFSNDLDKAMRIAECELFAGACFINDFVKSDPRMPFGGVKQSGFGRELGEIGIKEFMNVKTICVK